LTKTSSVLKLRDDENEPCGTTAAFRPGLLACAPDKAVMSKGRQRPFLFGGIRELQSGNF
jgi:hypothetical protein